MTQDMFGDPQDPGAGEVEVPRDPEEPTEAEVIEETSIIETNRQALRPTTPEAVPKSIVESLNLQELAVSDPAKLVDTINKWADAVETIRERAVKSTRPIDWVLMKTNEGVITGFPKRSGCEKIRKILGISIYNVQQPATQEDPKDHTRIAVSVVGDGVCGLTRETVEGVRGLRSSSEKFIGRAAQWTDLFQAARSALDNRITRILGAVSQVELAELARIQGMTPEEFEGLANKGSGYGSAAQREASRATGGGSHDAKERELPKAKAWWDWLLVQYAGSTEEALAVMRKSAEFEGDGGKTITVRDWKQFTEKWLNKAIHTYHEMFTPLEKFEWEGTAKKGGAK